MPGEQTYWSIFKGVIASVYTAVVMSPLKRLYFDGPRFYGHGFWKGAAPQDICAALTNHDSDFWLQHSDACQQIIDKDFYAIVVLAETIGYFIVLYFAVKLLYRFIASRQRNRNGAVER